MDTEAIYDKLVFDVFARGPILLVRVYQFRYQRVCGGPGGREIFPGIFWGRHARVREFGVHV